MADSAARSIEEDDMVTETRESNESLVFDALLDATDDLNKTYGIETAAMARGTAHFLVQLCFDNAPNSDHAMHLILSSILHRLEANIEGE